MHYDKTKLGQRGWWGKCRIAGPDPNGDNLIAGQNPYKNINKILEKLGITSSPVAGHQNHFHIYLKPPTPLNIGPANLLTDVSPASASDSTSASTLQVEAQSLLDYTQSIVTGEELMFTMDVPSVPAQDASIALIQVATGAASLSPDYQLTVCKETESIGDPKSAMRAVDPAGMLQVYIANRDGHPVELADIKNVVLLQDTTAGKITSVLDNTGRSWYRYDPPANYEGTDKAIFMAEYQGERYKIVIELHVFQVVDESASSCSPPKLIKASSVSTFEASPYQLNSFTVTFGNLGDGAIGQTTGTTITLDTAAAGHGWYIDPTPLDNSDDYLPTSNPNVWQAKAGSDAAGKTDLLSVLLHEYASA